MVVDARWVGCDQGTKSKNCAVNGVGHAGAVRPAIRILFLSLVYPETTRDSGKGWNIREQYRRLHGVALSALPNRQERYACQTIFDP